MTGRNIDAIYRGAKTQTRRVVREPAGYRANYIMQSEAPIVMCRPSAKPTGQTPERELRCPYGNKGDLLWVKEAWHMPLEQRPSSVLYRADIPEAELARIARSSEPIPWRSPLLMPQRYARLWLRITHVRAQLLDQISDNDIVAEGLEPAEAFYRSASAAECPSLRDQFRRLWDGIHREHPARQWSRKPLVWALTFQRCPAPA